MGQEGLQIGAALGISNRGRDSVIMSVRKIKKDGDTEYIMSYTLTFLGTKKKIIADVMSLKKGMRELRKKFDPIVK